MTLYGLANAGEGLQGFGIVKAPPKEQAHHLREVAMFNAHTAGDRGASHQALQVSNGGRVI